MKHTALVLFIFSLLIVVGCQSDPYLEMPKECVTKGNRQVVCATEPVRLKDLINQPRSSIESLLGKDVKKKLGFVTTDKNFCTYRGGGIVVVYSTVRIKEEKQHYT